MHRPRAASTTMTEGSVAHRCRPELGFAGEQADGSIGAHLEQRLVASRAPLVAGCARLVCSKKSDRWRRSGIFASGVNTTMATQFQGTVTQPQPRSASRASLVLPEAACSAVLRC